MAVVQPLYVAKLRRARAAFVFDLGPVTLALATILVVSVTSLLYLTQASRVAATGYDISSAEEHKAQLTRDQQKLLAQVAEQQALSRIETEASGRLRLVPAPPPDYVRVGPPPADVEAALKRAEREAEHLPRGWREQLAALLRLWPAS